MCTGFVMVLQTLAGHRYPLLDGPASALLLSFIVLAPHGVPAIQGGMMMGGAFLIILSAFGLLRHLEPLFTDNVIGVILILIAITLTPYLAPMVVGAHGGVSRAEPLVVQVSVLVILSIALFSHWLPGFPKTISLFLGIVLGTLVLLGMGRLDFSAVSHAPWFSLPGSLFPSPPSFSVPACITFLFAYVAVIINAIGSMYSIGEIVGKEDMTGRVRRGIFVTGAAGLISGLIGVIGTVSYAISPGMVLITRVGSRFTVTVCGALIFGLAFFQKLLALLSSVPASVVGAAMVTGMAAQVGAGISVLTRTGQGLEGRDYLVIGIPMLLGGIASVLPGESFQNFPTALHALVQNGLVVGIVFVLLLEHVILPRRP
jgi:uracil permease